MAVSIDTRTLQPGDVFYALRGPRFDGHDFLTTAIAKGAAVLVAERPPKPGTDLPAAVKVRLVPDTLGALQDDARAARRAISARVIGLTGSNGKTTTKQMLASVLAQAGPTFATPGNFNNHIGLPISLLGIQSQHRFAVLELGTSMPGDMDLLLDLAQPEVGLITNVGEDHLEYFGSPDGVLQENRKLLDRLPAEGLAIINLDDPLLEPLASDLQCRTLTYSAVREADVRADSVRLDHDNVAFDLRIGTDGTRVRLPTPAIFQVQNALAASAVAHGLGLDLGQIRQGLEAFTPAAMRLQVQKHSSGSVLVNDAYNANPSSMRASIESFLSAHRDRSRWLVLGDMRELGPGAAEAHRRLGEWMSRQSVDRLYLYGRDTRFVLAGYQAAAPGCFVERFKKKRYLLAALRAAIASEKPAVLFKASRRLRLETLVQELVR